VGSDEEHGPGGRADLDVQVSDEAVGDYLRAEKGAELEQLLHLGKRGFGGEVLVLQELDSEAERLTAVRDLDRRGSPILVFVIRGRSWRIA
jgi:hypothetical protein